MIDSISNLLFRCSHQRLTRPVTPVSKAGVPQGETYVVCLDCGKQFSYDVREMRIGKPIAHSHETGVLPANMPKPRPSKIKVALWAAGVPLGMLIASALHRSKREPRPPKAPRK
jgi:hypothetical protein